MENFGNRIRLFFGYVFLFIGIGIFFIGVGMYFDLGDVKAHKQGFPIAVASSAIWIPGLIMVFLGRKWKKRQELMESMVSIIKSYRRISLVSISEKLAITIPVANGLLSDAIEIGLIDGNFDRTTDEFYINDAKDERVQIKFCEFCGASLDKIYYRGETIICKSCGSDLN